MARKLPELPIPEAARSDPRATEMIRAWVAKKGLHCSINVGHWHEAEPGKEGWCWGILLADVARHLGNALEERFGIDRRETIQAVRESFMAELDHPTSKHSGQFVNE